MDNGLMILPDTVMEFHDLFWGFVAHNLPSKREKGVSGVLQPCLP